MSTPNPKSDAGTTTKSNAPLNAGTVVEGAPAAKTADAKPEAPKKPEVIVKSARYGIDAEPTKRVDFAGTCKVGNKLTNRMVGSDPYPGVVKNAIITITTDGVEATKTFAEGEKIVF